MQELNTITNDQSSKSDLNKVAVINSDSNVDKLSNVNAIIATRGTGDIVSDQQKVNSIDSSASIANELSKKRKANRRLTLISHLETPQTANSIRSPLSDGGVEDEKSTDESK